MGIEYQFYLQHGELDACMLPLSLALFLAVLASYFFSIFETMVGWPTHQGSDAPIRDQRYWFQALLP